MSEYNENYLYSGQVETSCKIPPPIAIDCIKVDKVYEECKQTDVNEIRVDRPDDIEDYYIVNDTMEVECLKAELLEKECEITAYGSIRLWIKYEITYKINDEILTEIETFEKTAELSRAGEEGLVLQCDVYLQCLDAFVLDDTIVLCVGKLFVFKLIAHVQLLVPVLGFCPEPETCQVAGLCPTFEPDWPPYPAQE